MEYPEGSIEPETRPEDEGLHGPDNTKFEYSGEDGSFDHIERCGEQRVPLSEITDKDYIERVGPKGFGVYEERCGSVRPAKTYNSSAMYTMGSPSPRAVSLSKKMASDSKIPAAINITLT